MAGIGPPPTPTAILKLRGSHTADLRSDEPLAERGIPQRPAWLDDDTISVALWDHLAPTLDEMGVLTLADRVSLEALCRTYSRWREAEEFLIKNGQHYVRRNDAGEVIMVKRFPQVTIATEALSSLMRLIHEFGLSPAARARLTVNQTGVATAYKTKREQFFGT